MLSNSETHLISHSLVPSPLKVVSAVLSPHPATPPLVLAPPPLLLPTLLLVAMLLLPQLLLPLPLVVTLKLLPTMLMLLTPQRPTRRWLAKLWLPWVWLLLPLLSSSNFSSLLYTLNYYYYVILFPNLSIFNNCYMCTVFSH